MLNTEQTSAFVKSQPKEKTLFLNGKTLIIPKVLFWDSSINDLDPIIHKVAIIDRIVHYGTDKELKQAEDFFGKDELIASIKNLNYLSMRHFLRLKTIYKLKKKDIRCYSGNALKLNSFSF
ncbi:MAG: hypothetical protein SFY32_16815 [Bacteroidota bacterium]|nr:hypothetical protein [Bacteroidota bacterium]